MIGAPDFEEMEFHSRVATPPMLDKLATFQFGGDGKTGKVLQCQGFMPLSLLAT